jgi:hypothetical protein
MASSDGGSPPGVVHVSPGLEGDHEDGHAGGHKDGHAGGHEDGHAGGHEAGQAGAVAQEEVEVGVHFHPGYVEFQSTVPGRSYSCF